MASGNESSYNYNNLAYSPTGYPFSGGQLKLQASFSTVVYSSENQQSTVNVVVTLKNRGIDWGFSAGREVHVYWNDVEVAKFSPPSMHESTGRDHINTLGSASFIAQHNDQGEISGTIKVEWHSGVLNYTVEGQTINVTELGCKANINSEDIPELSLYTLVVNGKDMIPYIAEDGIDDGRASRLSKSITTLKGTKLQKEVKKHQIQIKLLDMSADQYISEIAPYLLTNPARVSYSNLDSGVSIASGTFYVINIKRKIKKVIRGTTYLTGLSFELEEK